MSTVLDKLDAAANCVAQIRIALMVGDTTRISHAAEQAQKLLFEMQIQIENSEAKEA